MIITQVNDAAYVAATIHKELLRRGIDSRHLKRTRSRFGKTIQPFINAAKAEGVIHVHYALQDSFAVWCCKHKLDIVHCHGTDVRGMEHSRWGRLARFNLKRAKVVFVSSLDLLETVRKINGNSRWIPNPIDTEMFSPDKTKKANAVYLAKNYEQPPKHIFARLEKEFGIRTEILRYSHRYDEMPGLLNKYEVFIDQQRTWPPSKTCLEAMSCGLKVILCGDRPELDGNKNRNYILEQHGSRKIVDMLMPYYEGGVKCRRKKS